MPRMVKKKKLAKKSSKPNKKAAVKKAVKKTTKKAVSKTIKSAKPLAGKKTSLAIGASVPAFTMPATQLGTVSAASLKGKPFVLYFYPKDDTSGCTLEACGFRDAVPTFNKLGITVIGVSKDSIKSHEKFAKKYDLTFPLASDEGTKICELFGTYVQKSMYGRSYMGIERSTFLIDGKGIIRAVWRKVSVPGHVDEVTKAIAEL